MIRRPGGGTVSTTPEPEPFAPCPQCSFGNPPAERTCLFCGAPLPFHDVTRRVSRRLVDRATELAAGEPPPPPTSGPAPPTQGSSAERQAAPSSRLRRVSPQAAPERPLGLLCCRPLPPLPLGPVPVIMIGRSPECHVVLPHLEVSRHHCSIKVRRQHLVIEDEGSSNGTLVNERRVSSADLKVGDVITIGPYVMEVLDEDRAAAWEEQDEHAEAAVDVSHAMSGRIDEVPLGEVLQGLEFNKRTGTLQVASGRRRGQLVVEDGRPLSAAFQSLRDDRAVLALLSLTEGRFSFVRTPELGQRRMEGMTLTGLLLESTRRLDEGTPIASGSDWDLQVDGGSMAPAIGVGPLPRAARLSPAMRQGPADPADPSAADTIVPDASDDADDADDAHDAHDAPRTRPHQKPVSPAPQAAPWARDAAPGPTARFEPRRAASDQVARVEPAPPITPPPAPMTFVPEPAPGRSAALPWSIAAALAVACVALLARSPADPKAQGAALRERAVALTRDVDQALASSRSLHADGPQIAVLRGQLAALRTLGAPESELVRAEAGVSLLEGLAAAARNDAGAVEVALGRSSGADLSPAASSALLGAAVAVSGDGDLAVAIEHLSRAIDEGLARPDLRAWRARLRGRQGIEDVGQAATIIDDLRAVAGVIGLTEEDELLRARALLVLGRDEEAAPLLETLRARHGDAVFEVGLALAEQALARGDVDLAVRHVVAVTGEHGPDDPPPQAAAIAARVRRLAGPLLDDLQRERALSASSQARLLGLLRLTRLLGQEPLDEAAVAALLHGLDRPGEDLPIELCLGVADVAGCDDEAVRRRVLQRIYRAMEEGTETQREANLTLLICFVVSADPRGVARPAHLVEAVRHPHVRAELFHARALAREQLGRVREAALDARRALQVEPGRPDLEALRARLDALVKSAPPPRREPPPPPRPRRRVG
jgi:hypothetical protein